MAVKPARRPFLIFTVYTIHFYLMMYHKYRGKPMKSRKRILCLFLIMLSLGAQGEPTLRPDYRSAARFSQDRMKKMVFSTWVDAHWLKLSDRFWHTFETPEGKNYYLVDPSRKDRRLLFDPVEVAARVTEIVGDPFEAKHLPIENLKFVKDETAIRFDIKSTLDEEEKKEEGEEKKEEGEQKKKETKGKPKKKVFTFEYDLRTGILTHLEDYEKDPERPRWAGISPDGETVVFSKHYNLYRMGRADYEKALKDEKDTTIVEHAITTDGEERFGYGGRPRGTTDQKWEKDKDKRQPVNILWSRDSKKFALIRTDERKVKELWVIHHTSRPRPELETYTYHMPGEKEAPQYQIEIFDVQTDERLVIPAERFKDQSLSLFRASRLASERDDDYTPALWLSETSDELHFSRSSRDLHRIDICVADANTGEVKVLVEERLNTYVEIRTPGLVGNGRQLVQWSERDGWAHFYLYDDRGNLVNRITSGPFHCQRIVGIDEKERVLYFTANGREPGQDPYYEHLYRVNLDGSGLKLLNPGNYTNQVSMNDGNRYFVNNYSRVNTVPKAELRNHRGEKIMDLETADLSLLMETGFRFPEPFRVKADDGLTDLYGVMYKPFDFDSTLKYPVVAYVYPGPQTEAVNKSFSTRMDRVDRLAQVGFIVITVGNRGGHPDRSKWYHNYGYGDLRDYGLADKKTAIEQLALRHPFIDIERVGIFGHSGGGFMSTAAMLVYPDFFHAAVSSSGNHENNIYNRWWSEKHHGVKEVIDEEGNVTFHYDIDTNSELAANLKGHLLLATGDVDNNVHAANTLVLARALIKANKRFDFFVFPGQRHGYGDMSEYFFWLMADHFSKYLLGHRVDDVDIVEINRDRPLKKGR